MSDADLQRLAAHAGILPRYHDLAGTEHVTGPETQAALLAAMGLPSEAAAAAEMMQGIAAADAARTIPAEIILTADTPFAADWPRASGPWELHLEDGQTLHGDGGPGVALPPLPAGYHRLFHGGDTALVIAAPPSAPSPAALTGRARLWGVTGALYALRSARNHGLGDFEDLAAAAEAMAGHGADFIGINPVHALGNEGGGFSPYSPSHRGFYNTRHIAIDRVPEFAASSDAQQLLSGNGDAVAELHAGALLDHTAADKLSRQVLRALFQAFENHAPAARRRAFDAFRAARGSALEMFATFEAISASYGPDPAQWPAALQRADSDAVQDFAQSSQRDVRFHIYLQWLADSQLADAQRRATEAGMGLGLYCDLAVGVRPDGAEPWGRPDVFARGVSLGVPPDAFNAAGQVWGLAPISPSGLAARGYRPLIETLQAVMRHAGLIRIDHAIGLMRCFWVPEGGLPGAYVRLPMAAILAIIRIEAMRARCVVIGEDLGVVPDGLRQTLADNGLYGVSVMQFERGHDGGFTRPGDYRRQTLASFGTHDTPTLQGYWQGADIETRREIGQFNDETAGWERDRRGFDRHQLLRLLQDAGALPDGIDPHAPPPDLSPALTDAVHRVLGMTAADLAALQLDDILGSARQSNFPGTTDAYPNWRIPCDIDVGKLADDPRIVAAGRLMAALRPRGDDAAREQREA